MALVQDSWIEVYILLQIDYATPVSKMLRHVQEFSIIDGKHIFNNTRLSSLSFASRAASSMTSRSAMAPTF